LEAFNLVKKREIPVVNVIRGLTSLIIVLYHFCNYQDPQGALFANDSFLVKSTVNFFDAVNVFFFISGFILPWAMFFSNYKLSDYPVYFLKRILRIHPPYFLSVIISVLIAVFFQLKNGDPVFINIKEIVAHFFYANPFLHIKWLNIIFWTLAVEIQFYLFVGFIFPLLNSKVKLVCYLPIVGFLLMGYFFQSEDYFTGYSIPFSAGMLFFLYYKTASKFKLVHLFLCIALVVFQLLNIPNSLTKTVFLILTIVMLLINWPINFWFSWLGETSYSLYLTHGFFGSWFIYYLKKYLVDGFFWQILILIGAIIISLIGARIYYFIIENPSKKWAAKIKYKRQAAEVSL